MSSSPLATPNSAKRRSTAALPRLSSADVLGDDGRVWIVQAIGLDGGVDELVREDDEFSPPGDSRSSCLPRRRTC